jgi:hypothetical protein
VELDVDVGRLVKLPLLLEVIDLTLSFDEMGDTLEVNDDDVKEVDLDVDVTKPGVDVVETWADIEFRLLVVSFANIDDVEAGVKNVLVLSRPVTPIIVWASPAGTSKVPFPLWQSQDPLSAAGPQHQLSPAQYSIDPLFCKTGSSTSSVSEENCEK